MIESKAFNDFKDWIVATDYSFMKDKVKFIIYRNNADGSRDVLTKKGKVCNVPFGRTVDSMCGALVVVKEKDLK